MQLGGVFWAIVGNINSPGEIAAMTLAIMTFCVVCALVDHALAQRHLITLRIRLVIAVYVKMALQFYPAIEPSAGIVGIARTRQALLSGHCVPDFGDRCATVMRVRYLALATVAPYR